METYLIDSNDCQLQVYARGVIHTTAMIFLHGGPGSGARAIFELPAFQAFEDAYLCVHFDQRGCGESQYDLQKGLTIEQVCQDVKVVIDDTKQRYGCKHIVLWGGSYGGTLACLYMQTIGKGVDAVILNNPAITFDRSQAIAFYESMREASLQRIPEKMRPIQNGNVNPEKDLQDDTFKAFVYSNHNPSKSLRHICAMSSWFFKTSFKEALLRTSLPTLLLLGREDTICGNENTIQVVTSSANPHMELHVLSPCGHAIFEDREKEFVDITKTFLQDKGY